MRVSGRLPWKVEGGVYASVMSGDFYTPTLTLARAPNYRILDGEKNEVVINRDVFRSVAGQEVYLESRGSREFDLRSTIDARAQRAFRVSRLDVVLGVEVFNLLNMNAITAVNTTVNNQVASDLTSQFGAVRFRQAPTTVRLNTQIHF